MNGPTHSNATLQWTPPPNAGNVVYRVEVTGIDLTIDTNSTEVTVPMFYNTLYTARVSILLPCASQETTSLFQGKKFFVW